MSAFQKALDRLKTTRAWSAWQRYGSVNGDLLAAGVAYFAFFSIFPALALAFAIFGFVLQGHPEWLDAIADSLNKALPGMVKTAENPNGIISLTAPGESDADDHRHHRLRHPAAGRVSAGSARCAPASARSSASRPATGNAVTTRLRDLGVLSGVGLLIAVSAILSSAIGGLAGTIADWVGLPGGAVLVGLVGLLAGIFFDTLIMVVLLRVLSGRPAAVAQRPSGRAPRRSGHHGPQALRRLPDQSRNGATRSSAPWRSRSACSSGSTSCRASCCSPARGPPTTSTSPPARPLPTPQRCRMPRRPRRG